MEQVSPITWRECEAEYELGFAVDWSKLKEEVGIVAKKTGNCPITVIEYQGTMIRHQVCKGGKIIARSRTPEEIQVARDRMQPVYEACRLVGEAPIAQPLETRVVRDQVYARERVGVEEWKERKEREEREGHERDFVKRLREEKGE